MESHLGVSCRTWLGRLACVLTLAGTVGCGVQQNRSMVMFAPPDQDLSVADKDGLLTATFSDATDDAILNAVLPTLVARGVQSITLRGAPVRDIRPLAGIVGLKALDISGTQVRDLTPLAALTGLKSLNLQFLPISDLTPVAGLVDLRFLNLVGTEVVDLTPLASLTGLRDVTVAVTNVNDLRSLAPLRQLTSLDPRQHLGQQRSAPFRHGEPALPKPQRHTREGRPAARPDGEPANA